MAWTEPGAYFYPIYTTFESDFLLQEVNKAKPGTPHLIVEVNIQKVSTG
jgi:hypothetical protein